MPDATQVYAFAYEGHWAMSASVTFAGVTTGMSVTGTQMLAAGLPIADVIVDGISVRYTKAGGGAVVSPIVYTGPEAGHFLNPFTTAVTNGPQSYAPLGVVARLSDHDAFKVTVTTANLESVMLSAWGRLLVKDDSPKPVDVRSVQLWPKAPVVRQL